MVQTRDLGAQPGGIPPFSAVTGLAPAGLSLPALTPLRRFGSTSPGYAGDATDLDGSLDRLLLELGRVSLLRDAFHVVLPVIVSIARRLRRKTKFGGRLTLRGSLSGPETRAQRE
ncbi:hypothetical protein [Methylococcus capsulatus]|uniref:hypothetical protein n=1 Tax=Methylococcus capsulatus TaxID=414 RepID=UPI002017C74F|nr:hypothetical protein [Methylococcus capsulatus]UQN10881.1 hypothetical protein M3M30_07415 [Methylococcus capsulatus]